MKTTIRTEKEAMRASMRPRVIKPDWYPALITEAFETVAKSSGKECIELTVMVGDRTFRDWLSDADRVAAKLRHCCQACGDDVLARYEASGEVTQDDFPGHEVEVKITVVKQRGWPDQNRIEDYRAPAARRVVNLRAG